MGCDCADNSSILNTNRVANNIRIYVSLVNKRRYLKKYCLLWIIGHLPAKQAD